MQIVSRKQPAPAKTTTGMQTTTSCEPLLPRLRCKVAQHVENLRHEEYDAIFQHWHCYIVEAISASETRTVTRRLL